MIDAGDTRSWGFGGLEASFLSIPLEQVWDKFTLKSLTSSLNRFLSNFAPPRDSKWNASSDMESLKI